MHYPVLCTSIRQGTLALTLFCSSTKPRSVYVCLHLIILTYCSTYMSLLMHSIYICPSPWVLFPNPTPMIVPLPPHMYHCTYPALCTSALILLVNLCSSPSSVYLLHPVLCTLAPTPPCVSLTWAPTPSCEHLPPPCQVYTHTHYVLRISVNTPLCMSDPIRACVPLPF